MTDIVAKITTHLVVVFGKAEADRIVADCLREAGLESATEVGALLRLGSVLVKRGGFLEVVGRYVRVQAIARECPGASQETVGVA